MKTSSPIYQLTDNELIDLIIEKYQNNLFDVLHYRYSKKVFGKCLTMIKNEGAARELTQDIFVKVYTHLSTFQKKSSFSTWLYRITYNECIDYLRKNKKNKKDYSISDAINNYLSEKLQEEELTEEDIEEIDFDTVKELMNLITEQDRQLLLMKYDLKFTIKEISGHTNLSESAIKMRLKRAKTKLTRLYFVSKK